MVANTSTPASGAVGRLTPPGRGPLTRWPRFSDAVLAFVVFALEVIGVLVRVAGESGEFDISSLGDVPSVTYLLLAASSIALVWRRSRPLIVLMVTLAASLVWDVIGLAGGASLAIFISLYGVGRYIEEDRASFMAVGVALVLVVADDWSKVSQQQSLGCRWCWCF